MKRLKYILSLLLFVCCLPSMAQSDIELTDSTSTDWGDNIGGGFLPALPYYEIVYILDGIEYKRESIVKGNVVIAPEAPAKEGYTFSGWTGVPATMPAKDVTVTGGYTINHYTLIYMVGGIEYKKIELEYGANITAESVPTKEGHTFSGWSELPETMPARDVTVEGSFTVNRYKITYTVDGEEYATDSIAYGETIVLEEEPVKEGYLFSGWSEIPETMPAEDIEVTGHFEVDGIDEVLNDQLVDVYTLQGVMLKHQISVDELKSELSRGIYIINGKKVVVR